MNLQSRTQKITMIAMLSALAFVIMAIGRIPFMSIPGLTLKYDPKDIVIITGGFLYGPVAAACISVLVSFIEMITVSDNGPWGMLMNIVSSCSFAVTAAVIYKYKRTLAGAVIGLVSGVLLTAFMMVLWNYLVTPLYLGIPRAVVSPLLMSFFLPFNLIKGGINAAATMIIYKPVAKVLRTMSGMPESAGDGKLNIAAIITAAAVIVICAIIVLLIN